MFLNKNPAGKVFNIVFGLAEILDGLVRLFSFGFLATTLTLNWSRYGAKRSIEIMKRKL